MNTFILTAATLAPLVPPANSDFLLLWNAKDHEYVIAQRQTERVYTTTGIASPPLAIVMDDQGQVIGSWGCVCEGINGTPGICPPLTGCPSTPCGNKNTHCTRVWFPGVGR
jgi:hypothetical protein